MVQASLITAKLTHRCGNTTPCQCAQHKPSSNAAVVLHPAPPPNAALTDAAAAAVVGAAAVDVHDVRVVASATSPDAEMMDAESNTRGCRCESRLNHHSQIAPRSSRLNATSIIGVTVSITHRPLHRLSAPSRSRYGHVHSSQCSSAADELIDRRIAPNTKKRYICALSTLKVWWRKTYDVGFTVPVDKKAIGASSAGSLGRRRRTDQWPSRRSGSTSLR
jgi:hypothetical protein